MIFVGNEGRCLVFYGDFLGFSDLNKVFDDNLMKLELFFGEEQLPNCLCFHMI